MTVRFPYGKSSSELIHTPENSTLISPSVRSTPLSDDQLRLQLLSSIPTGKKLTILVPDGTRPLPVADLLSILSEEIADRDVTVLVARGTHREMTTSEIATHLGVLPGHWRVIQNRCDDDSEYVDIGTTRRGTPVSLHRTIMDADSVLALTLVRPHYYAGYSGGRKILLPGGASRRTIQANHRHVLHDDPALGKNMLARLANLEGNPIHEDMTEAMRLFEGEITLLHFIMAGKDIVYLTSGGEEAFHKAIAFLRTHNEIRVKEPFDTVILSYGGHPRDINFIQSHKAIENVFQAVREGGSIYLYAACTDGLGSDEMSQFLALKNIPAITESLHRDFRIYGHTALSLLTKLAHCRIHLHSNLPAETLKLLQIAPWNGTALPGAPGRTALVPDASMLYLPGPEGTI